MLTMTCELVRGNKPALTLGTVTRLILTAVIVFRAVGMCMDVPNGWQDSTPRLCSHDYGFIARKE